MSQPKKSNYKDLSFSFEAHPVTGDLISKTGDYAIKQSIKNIVLTQHFERIDAKLGSRMYNSLFELNSFIAINTLKERLSELVARYEPRVNVLGVYVETRDDNKIKVTISFTTHETPDPIEVDVFVDRIR